MNVVDIGEAFTLTKTFKEVVSEEDFALEIIDGSITRRVDPEEITFVVTNGGLTLSISLDFTNTANEGSMLIVKLLRKDLEELSAGDWFSVAGSASIYVRDPSLVFPL